MERHFLDFCDRQAAKMIKYADGCPDPELKDDFLQMAACWLKTISAPSWDKQKIVPFERAAR